MITAVPRTDVLSGYERDPALQQAFEEAAEHLRSIDGWLNPQTGTQELRADLALEGGGVKGIGLVGAILALSEAGYSFRCVAGTSAGAIAASLVAALSHAGKPMTDLLGHMESLDFSNFMPDGRLHHLLHDVGGHVGDLALDAGDLAHKMGIYPGDYLATWLAPILHDLQVHTFADLKLTPVEDPGLSLPDGCH
jgi:NTE family protein